MSDEEMYRHYADPDNRVPAGEPRRRNRGMSSHVPIRFRPEIIAEVKYVARNDGKTISSWIRELVERELERRRPPEQTVTGSDVTDSGTSFWFVSVQTDSPITSAHRELEQAR